jgi:hypothetical protein
MPFYGNAYGQASYDRRDTTAMDCSPYDTPREGKSDDYEYNPLGSYVHYKSGKGGVTLGTYHGGSANCKDMDLQDGAPVIGVSMMTGVPITQTVGDRHGGPDTLVLKDKDGMTGNVDMSSAYNNQNY